MSHKVLYAQHIVTCFSIDFQNFKLHYPGNKKQKTSDGICGQNKNEIAFKIIVSINMSSKKLCNSNFQRGF